MKTKNKNICKRVGGLLSVALCVAGAFLFSSCGKEDADYGKFTEDEIVVSIGDEIEITNYYKVGNRDIQYVTSNGEILSSQDDLFRALKAGSTYIYSVYDGKNVDYIKITVKDTFAKPSAISVNDEGLLSWEKVSIIKDGQEVFAKYEVEITDESENKTIINCETNSYQLAEKGVYKVRVRCLENDVTLASEYSTLQTVYYSAMLPATNLVFTASEEGSVSKGTLIWDPVANAKYNVIVGDLLFATTETSMNIDLTLLSKSNVKIYVETIDLDGHKKTTKSEIKTITKLGQPLVNYLNGDIVWESIENAAKYFVKCVNVNTNQIQSFYVNENTTNLNNIGTGNYRVYVQAIGENEYVNGNFAELGKEVYKLPSITNFIASLVNGVVTVKVTTNEIYGQGCKIFENGIASDVALVQEGNKYIATRTYNINDVGVYKYRAQLIADKGQSNEYYVVNSNKSMEYTFYKLGQTDNIAHELNGAGESLIIIDSVENAENYSVKIGNTNVAINSIGINDGRTTLNLGVLDKEALGMTDGSQFTISITAKRSDLTTVIPSTTIKEFNVLSAPTATKLNGNESVDKNYTWDIVENAQYKYLLYKTNEDYDTTGITPTEITTATPSTDELEVGFYVIKVYTLPNDESAIDNVGSSSYLEDRFYVATQLAQPYIVDFEYDENHDVDTSGYVLRIEIPEAEEYERNCYIGLKSGDMVNVLDVFDVNGTSLVYRFANTYNFASGTNNIVVYLQCPNIDDAKLYKTSNDTSLKVVRLDRFTGNSISVDNNQVLTLTKPEDVVEVEIKKGGSVIESIDNENSVQLNVSEWTGENILSVKYLGYKTYTEKFTNSTIYLDSIESSINIARDKTPTNLKYDDGMVSFDHDGQATQFGLKITIITENGTKSWNTIVSQKSFKLENLTTIINDPVFNTYFTQKQQVEIEIYSITNKYDSEANKYYIDSKSVNEGTTSITITKLNKVLTFAYDKENNRLIWTSNNPEGTYYDIYHNGNLYKSKISSPISISEGVYTYACSLSDLVVNEGLNVSNAFYVVAKATNKMTSSTSKTISIYKLKAVGSLSIKTDLSTGKNYAEFTIDEGMKQYVSEIMVNGVANTTKKIELSNETESLTIQLIAITADATSSFGYLDSDATLFTLNKSNIAYTDGLAISEDDGRYLVWNKYNDLVIASNLKYKVYAINSSSGVAEKEINGDVTKLDLNDAFFADLESDTYTIKMCAYTKNYALNSNGVGGYLYKEFETTLNVSKYAAVNYTGLSFSGEVTDVATEKDRDVTFAWAFDDTGLSGIKYKVKFVNNSNQVIFDEIVTTKSYTIEQSKILGGGTLSITVYSAGNLYGATLSQKIKGYSVSGATLYDTGNLFINGTASKYLITMSYNSTSKSFMLENGNNISLTKYFEEIGVDDKQVSIEIIAVGVNDTVASKSYSIINRTVLGEGSYEISGNKIYFESKNAQSVKIVYNNQTTSIANKSTIYIPNTQTDSNYSYKVYSNKKEIEYTEKEVFVFEIPDNYIGTEFKYYFSDNNSDESSTGKIDSYHKKVDLTISHLNAITDVNVTIDNTYKPVAWVSGSATKLLVEIYNSSNLITTMICDKNKIPFSDIEENVQLNIGIYTFKVYAITNYAGGVLSYSSAYTFTYEKKEGLTSDEFGINDKGYLSWNNTNGENYVVNKTYIVNTNWFDVRKLGSATTMQVTKLGNIPFGTYGTTETDKYVAGSTSNNSFTYYVASESKSLEITKTNDFTLTQDTDGTILLSPSGGDLNVSVNIEYNNKVYTCVSTTDTVNAKVRVRLIDIISALGEDFEGGISSIKISTVKTGCIKSTSVECSVKLEVAPVSYTIQKIKGGVNDFVTEFIDYDSVNMFNYMAVQVYKGNTKKYDGIREINLVKGLDVNALLIDELNMADGETYTIKVAPIHKLSEIYIQYNWLSDTLTYYRLKAVSALNHVYTNDGYSEAIVWDDNNNDVTNEVGYYIVNTKYDTPTSTGIATTINNFDNREDTYANFISGSYYTVGVHRICKTAGYIYSSETMYKSGVNNVLLYRNDELNPLNFTLNDGILRIEANYGSYASAAEASEADVDAIFESGDLLKMLYLVNEHINSNLSYIKYNSPLKLANALLDAVIKTPITFKLRNLASDIIELRFVKEATSIIANVKAIQLMTKLDVEYIEILEKLAGKISASDEYSALSGIITMFKDTNNFTGVACDKVLFDEMDSKGNAESVGYGMYSLHATQKGNSSSHTIRGKEVQIMSSVEVLTAPSMSITTEIISYEEKDIATRYIVKFKPIDNATSSINNYKLILSPTGSGDTIVANIDYVGGAWKLSYSDRELTLATTPNGFVILPLNTIGKESGSRKIGIDEILQTQDIAYKASIYGLGTGTQFNSKSDVITISYLPINTISLINGELCWNTVKIGTEIFDTSVFYKKKNNTYSLKETISTTENKAYYSMTEAGEYDVLALYTQGRVEGFTIYVDSDIQVLENIVKLYAPEIDFIKNEIVLTDSPYNNYTSTEGYIRKYKVTNNESKDYYITEEVANTYNYIVGLNSYVGEYAAYKATEKVATIFNFENVGLLQPSLMVDEQETFDGFGTVDILHLNNPDYKIFLKSRNTTANAEMIGSTEGLPNNTLTQISLNKEGDFEWKPMGISNVGDSPLSSNTNIVVYEVTVNKYTKNGEIFDLSANQIIYTTNTTLSSEKITIPNNDIQYYYNIAVIANVYSTTNNLLGQIETLEGNVYYKLSGATYVNEKYVLKSEMVEYSKTERFPQVEGLSITNGYITWEYDRAKYTNAEFKVYYSVHEDGSQMEELAGKIVYDGNSVKFDPDAMDASKTYYLWVKVVNNGTIENNYVSSLKEKYSSSFTKLKDFDRSCVTVNEDADGYILDFSGYTTYSGTNNYKLEVKVLDYTIELSSVNSVIKLYEIGYTGGSLSIAVLAKSTVNNVINAEQVNNIIFTAPSWGEEDSITWNATKQQFEWTFTNASEGIGEYFDVEIVTVNESKSNGTTTTVTTTQKFSDIAVKYFKPITLGKIECFKVYAKNSPSNFKSESALIFDCTVGIKFNLFTSGNGTSESPYIINTAAQFANINYRSVRESYYRSYKEQVTTVIVTASTNKTEKSAETIKNIDALVYYKQNANLVVNVNGFAIEEFAGVYDGNSKTLTINGEGGYSKGTSLKNIFNYSAGNGTTDYLFDNMFSVIKKASTGSEIKNLTFNLSFNYSGKIAIAGLVGENEGVISNIIISSASITTGSYSSAISLLVGVNKGQIINCINNAEVTTSSNESSILTTMALTNSGSIVRCINNGKLTANGPTIVSGIAFINTGIINICGNNVEVISDGCASGLIYQTTGGTVKYSWNTGAIQSKAQNKNEAGIIYSSSNTTLNSVFAYGTITHTDSSRYLFKTASGTTGSCYTYNTTTGFATITRETLSSMTISTDSGYKVVLTSVAVGYSITYTNA